MNFDGNSHGGPTAQVTHATTCCRTALHLGIRQMTALLDDPERLLLGAQIGITDFPDDKAARQRCAVIPVIYR